MASARELARSTSWVVAHPLRFRIMEVLREGPSTSARIAQRLGESRGSISYHLRMLGRVGAIAEAPELGTKRERWWRREPELVVFPNDPDGEGRAISRRWAALFFARDEEVRHRFITHDVPRRMAGGGGRRELVHPHDAGGGAGARTCVCTR